MTRLGRLVLAVVVGVLVTLPTAGSAFRRAHRNHDRLNPDRS
jgi:hypothetical protein